MAKTKQPQPEILLPQIDNGDAIAALGRIAGQLEKLYRSVQRRKWSPAVKACTMADIATEIKAVRMGAAALIGLLPPDVYAAEHQHGKHGAD